MKKGVFFLVVCLMLYFIPAHTDSEMVWLKDVNTSFETDKRTVSDPDLPNELSFHLNRASQVLTLNLKRNHGIDPNADIYVVQKLIDGQSHLEKTRNLGKEVLAYYQDRENGAFMTVRCDKRNNGQCNRIINGNIRIGDVNYDLVPAETDVTTRNLLDVPDRRGSRYFLHDQATVQRDILRKKDEANVNTKSVEQILMDFLLRFPQEQVNRNNFHPTNSMLSSRNVAGLQNRRKTDARDSIKEVYWVDIAVLIDSTIWERFEKLMLSQTNAIQEDDVQIKRKIREAYSHIINGVNLLYKEIDDTNIEININLREFFIFKAKTDFPHIHSTVKEIQGVVSIEMNKYADDIAHWDRHVGSKYNLDYDHAMLFTGYELYDEKDKNGGAAGVCLQRGGICNIGERYTVVTTKDFFFWTVSTAAHELGHNLGAVHDGSEGAESCSADDSFIMSPDEPLFGAEDPYSRNPWMFSNCTVETFKKTLKNKTCLTRKGILFNEEEWANHVMKQPGEVYNLNEQCEINNGAGSVFCGDVSADICLFMECTDPETGDCLYEYARAARGTSCGVNMWCIEGKCVSKTSK